MSEQSFTPPQQLKSALRPSDLVPPRKAPEHHVDFQATFPGWPKGYFMGLLPVVSLKALYKQMGYPAYAYTDLEGETLDTPFANSRFMPTTPDPMYVNTMPWTTYPYGIPCHAPTSGKPVEELFLAVPLSKEKIKKTMASYWNA